MKILVNSNYSLPKAFNVQIVYKQNKAKTHIIKNITDITNEYQGDRLYVHLYNVNVLNVHKIPADTIDILSINFNLYE